MRGWSTSTNNRLKQSAGMEKSEVQAQVEEKMKRVMFLLGFDLSLPQPGLWAEEKQLKL